MKISVVAIGDELLIGQVTDTNSGSIARIIEPGGWSIDNVQVVHDDAESITRAIDTALSLTDVVITTGGLGPTKDDITKQVMCRYFGGTLEFDPTVLENVKEIFNKRGLQLNELTRSQAMVPTSCRVIQNRLGTAPIMWFEKTDESDSENGAPCRRKILVAMPGVPFETVSMFESEVFPQLRAAFPDDNHIGHRNVILSGITESDAAERLDEWERALPSHLHLAYLPKQGIIRLRIDGRHTDAEFIESELDRAKSELIGIFGEKVLADEDLTPEQALIEILREKGLTFGSAESCTGGNIAHLITSVAGCSDVYLGSIVSYANDVKINLLGVNETDLRQYGAVSEQVASQMAAGACRALGVDCAVATSGIAGPGGGSEEKPVGTVCIAVATENGNNVDVRTFRFPGSRERVIDRASTAALSLLAMKLKN